MSLAAIPLTELKFGSFLAATSVRWTGLAAYESGAVMALCYDLLAIDSAVRMRAQLSKLFAKSRNLACR